jgi:hypothetical protein
LANWLGQAGGQVGQPTENGGNKHQGLRECKRDHDTFGKCDVLKIKKP